MYYLVLVIFLEILLRLLLNVKNFLKKGRLQYTQPSETPVPVPTKKLSSKK